MPTLLAALLATALALAGCAGGPSTQQVEDAPRPVLTLVEPAGGPSPAPADAPGPTRKALPAPGLSALELQVRGAPATGLLAVPRTAPDTLVVLAHGWGADAEAHRRDLAALAEAGALAVAMDYRGDQAAFKVRTGVEDTVAVALALQRETAIERTLLYGWSLGGEVALLAPLHAPPGSFDYVFAGAPVTDLESFWHEAPVARAAVEEETGGPPHRVAPEYASRSPRLHAQAFAHQGVTRVFLLHGAADHPVPVEHSERVFTALAEAGQPVSYYVVTKDQGAACIKRICAAPPTPGGHESAGLRLMWPFVEHRLQRLPDPPAAAARGTYDGETGEYEPSDVGGP